MRVSIASGLPPSFGCPLFFDGYTRHGRHGWRNPLFDITGIMLSKVHQMTQPEHESKTHQMQDPPSGFPEKESVHAILLAPKEMPQGIHRGEREQMHSPPAHVRISKESPMPGRSIFTFKQFQLKDGLSQHEVYK